MGTNTDLDFTRVFERPMYAGCLVVLPDVRVSLAKKPGRWRLFWLRVFFGWRWIPANPTKGQ